MNPRLKQLMKDLGDAINSSFSESDQIAQVIARIKDEGFDIFLVLEATVGFNRRSEETVELVRSRQKNLDPEFSDPEFSINAHDVRFLKSLRIRVDDSK